ncbi:MAG TPA: squalene/phytoene synthase family protein, partial [Gemmatimonadales bacterium]|nr:squalene/phytoene synthase family protein [Gemmatimonadales bacterium]
MLNTPARLEESYAAAERVTRQWARSFHFASTFLPPAKRRAVFAIYDFCRHADNLVDLRGPRSASDVRRDLARLGELVCRLHGGERPDDPRWLALWDSCRRYAIPLPPLLAMLEGVERDLGPVMMPDFAALHHYCTQVAGGVGLMLGPVLGARGEEFREFG